MSQHEDPNICIPGGDELLSVKELADQLKRTPRYVRAMVRDGFLIVGGRATVNQARKWLVDHPDFRQNKPLKPTVKK